MYSKKQLAVLFVGMITLFCCQALAVGKIEIDSISCIYMTQSGVEKKFNKWEALDGQDSPEKFYVDVLIKNNSTEVARNIPISISAYFRSGEFTSDETLGVTDYDRLERTESKEWIKLNYLAKTSLKEILPQKSIVVRSNKFDFEELASKLSDINKWPIRLKFVVDIPGEKLEFQMETTPAD